MRPGHSGEHKASRNLNAGIATPGYILRFWSPLAATWMMIALESLLVAAVIARLPDPKLNLAAHGVAFAIAIFIEAPVIMLMSASTTLVRDAFSYRRLRAFALATCGCSTALLILVLIPGVYRFVAFGVLDLPPEVARLTYHALWIHLPWSAAIGYRRFIHGVMIRAGKTRAVGLGTVARIASVTAGAIILGAATELPGAVIGSFALVIGVVFEAVVARWMAHSVVRGTLTAPPQRAPPPAAESYRALLRFYVPLSAMSILALATYPIFTFFMGRSPMPLESLAVFPIVNGLAFFFRSIAISYQEAAIALFLRHPGNRRQVARFALIIAGLSSLGLAVFAFTPIMDFWYRNISGLAPELAGFAWLPTIASIPLAGLSVGLSYQRALLMFVHRTRPIMYATLIEVGALAAVFSLLSWGAWMPGVTAAFVSFVLGRALANVYLILPTKRAVDSWEPTQPRQAAARA